MILSQSIFDKDRTISISPKLGSPYTRAVFEKKIMLSAKEFTARTIQEIGLYLIIYGN